jgi:glutathione-independent formaldehyde dehydrogenase
MDTNRAVVYKQPYTVEIESTPYPQLALGSRQCPHGVILKVLVTAICGSDLHMYRGRTDIPAGMILGHEITGEVIECGRDVEFIKKDDIVSVPFNVACGRCRNCKEQKTNACLHVNDKRAGGSYGYADMGGWPGGQAEYLLVPYADFNLLKLPSKEVSMPKIKDLAYITDILPTGYHGAFSAGVHIGSSVYIAGAGPVGLACALSCNLLGAAVVIVADIHPERLLLAKNIGCYTIDLSKEILIPEEVKKITGKNEVDFAIDCVGFEAHGYGEESQQEHPAQVLNTLVEVTRAGGALGIPGVYVRHDRKAHSALAKKGILELEVGKGWSKGLSVSCGQTPVMKYNRCLMEAIMQDKCPIAQVVNTKVISLDQAPQAYKTFEKGEACKYLIDPHGVLSQK